MKPRILFAGPMLGLHPGWVPAPAEALAPRLASMGYRCELTSQIVNRYLRMLDILQTIFLKRQQYDILCLQVYSGPSFVIEDSASWLAHALGKSVVMVLHGGNMPAFASKYPVWTRRVLQRADRLVAPSAFLARALHPYGFDPVIIPNALDLEQYPYVYQPQEPPGLLWMRTFHPLYHPEMAVNVLSLVRRAIPSVFLTMAGQEKGSLAAIQALAFQMGLADAVRFVGFLEPAGKKYEFAHHRIFLNTNRVDNMPVSVIEAAAFGLPVVATSVGGVPDMIENEINGILVSDQDVQAMAKAVIQLLSEHNLAQGISTRARRWAEQFDWPQVLNLWDKLLLEVG